jgi:DNA-directed RNA polymerase subunit M/transcription elongation factor TFIIS
MSEQGAKATATQKFSCPACGGESVWNPSQRALVCAYCGNVAPADLELQQSGEFAIVEHDLLTALNGIPESARGWQTQKTEVRCQSCHAITVFDPERVGQSCDFCGSSALIAHEDARQPFSPESLLEFKLDQTQVRERIRQWIRSLWFAPNALKNRAMVDTLHGLYVPYWTFDAQVDASWTAEAGYYYYVTERYRDSNGKTQTRQVRKVRWEPASGQLTHFFDDTLVAASKGVDPELLAKVEPFPTQELKAYHPGFLSGWVVERYQIDLGSAAQAGRQRMDTALRNLCASRVPGDTQRNLRVAAHYQGQTFKHILVPLWMVVYRYHGKPFQVLVNGFTGAIAGKRPWSIWKISLACLAAAVLVVLLIQGDSG